MSSSERVVYIQGVGDEPIEQLELPERLKPSDLYVDHQPVNWTADDYKDRRTQITEHIEGIADQQEIVSVIGVSGGGKVALDIAARNPGLIQRLVLVSAKLSPYVLKTATRESYPNLALSSDELALSLKYLNSQMLEKILCIHALKDNVVAPKDSVLVGAYRHIVRVDGHIEGIAHALTHDLDQIVAFIKQYKAWIRYNEVIRSVQVDNGSEADI